MLYRRVRNDDLTPLDRESELAPPEKLPYLHPHIPQVVLPS